MSATPPNAFIGRTENPIGAGLAARQSRLSAQALRALDQAERYPEGTGVRLLIKGLRDIPTVKKLAAVKLEN